MGCRGGRGGGREMNLVQMMSFVLDMLSLRYPAGYPGAKGLEGNRECEPGAQEKKIPVSTHTLHLSPALNTAARKPPHSTFPSCRTCLLPGKQLFSLLGGTSWPRGRNWVWYRRFSPYWLDHVNCLLPESGLENMEKTGNRKQHSSEREAMQRERAEERSAGERRRGDRRTDGCPGAWSCLALQTACFPVLPLRPPSRYLSTHVMCRLGVRYTEVNERELQTANSPGAGDRQQINI